MNDYARNAEFSACRIFGFVWIVVIVFLLTVIIENPANSGMAILFVLLSGSMAYLNLSGKFDASLSIMVPPLVFPQAPSVRARNMLKLIYSSEAIYLRKIVVYSPEQKMATGRFYVPMAHSSTSPPLEYVSAEQYIRCLSQLSYFLIGSLIADDITDLDFMDFKRYKQLMVGYRTWFRRIHKLQFVKYLVKNNDFELTLILKTVRTLRKFVVCVLEVKGPIRGEIEFIAPLDK